MVLRIKDTAKRKGYTMAKLAEKVNIDSTTLSRYNTGKVEAPLSRLKIIADALGCEIVELLPVGEKYAHWIQDGEYLGVYKKEKK